MLKKAGIVVAVAAAGVLAVSPLAFAGEKSGDDVHGHGHSTTKYSPTCTFGNASNAGTKQKADASSLLGVLANAATNAAAPVTTQTNAPIGSCNNFSDLVDINSNNKTKTVDNTKTVNNSKNINKSSTSTSSLTSTLTGLLGG